PGPEGLVGCPKAGRPLAVAEDIAALRLRLPQQLLLAPSGVLRYLRQIDGIELALQRGRIALDVLPRPRSLSIILDESPGALVQVQYAGRERILRHFR